MICDILLKWKGFESLGSGFVISENILEVLAKLFQNYQLKFLNINWSP